MASTDNSTSSQISVAATEEHKRTVDEAFLNKLKGLVERLRLDNATLKKSLDIERSEVRALKARHDSTIRNIKTECKKKEDLLEKQLRTIYRTEKNDEPQNNNKLVELKRLTTEIQSLKAANKGLQEKLKVSQAAECARAAELRAQVAKHQALEHAATRDARAQRHTLLEEIKSKERVIIQLKREATRASNEQNMFSEENTFKQYYFDTLSDEGSNTNDKLIITQEPLKLKRKREDDEEKIEDIFEFKTTNKNKKQCSFVSRQSNGTTEYLSSNKEDGVLSTHLIKIEIFELKKLVNIPTNLHWKNAKLRLKYYGNEGNKHLTSINKIIYNIAKDISLTDGCKKYNFKNRE